MDYEKYMEYVMQHHPDRAKIAFVKEEWRPIVYPNVDPRLYRVSSWGTIIDNTTGLSPLIRIRSGYYCVQLRGYNGIISADVHRIVAFTFLPLPKIDNCVVNHIDGNPFNNVYLNLEWITQQQNVQHGFIIGLNQRGTDKVEVYVTDEDIHYICKSLEECKTYDEIINHLISIHPEYTYNGIRSIISNIKQHKTYKHISCNYNIDNKHTHAKMSVADINKLCSMLEQGTSVVELMNEFNISEDDRKSFQQHVADIIRGTCYGSIGQNYNMKYPEGMHHNTIRFTKEQSAHILEYLKQGKSYDDILALIYSREKMLNMDENDIKLLKKGLYHIKRKHNLI